MSNYTKATNFLAKDSLPENDSGKIIKGSEFDTEFNALQTAVNTKADLASPALTGVPTAPTATAGTNTTQLATTAFVTTVANSLGTMSSQNATAVAITGGAITGITDLTVADGGTGVSTLSANAVLLGNGTSALQTVAPSTVGNVLRSNGTTWVSAEASPLMFILAAEANATASRSVFLTAGTWQVILQDAGGYVDGASHDFTVTRNGTVSTTTVTTSYRLLRSGGSGFGRYVYATDNAVGTLTVAAGGATVTMSIAAPSITGSGSPSVYAGAILYVSKTS
jgi:hypothetical protein